MFFVAKVIDTAQALVMKNLDFPLSFSAPKTTEIQLKTAYAKFLRQPFSYRKQFLQSHYKTAFDGYSYMGQPDSTNQYDYDLLHSFVLSDFQSPSAFPTEFSDFFYNDWRNLKSWIVKLETQLLRWMELGHLEKFYHDCIGHMISCNYYPKLSESDYRQRKTNRLSAHKDVSLFTTFPFGLDEGFSYYDYNNEVVKLHKTAKSVVFSGYFLEWFYGGDIPAINHLVEMPKKSQDSERYSFAIFSVPKPKTSFVIGDKYCTADEYFHEYLSLF